MNQKADEHSDITDTLTKENKTTTYKINKKALWITVVALLTGGYIGTNKILDQQQEMNNLEPRYVNLSGTELYFMPRTHKDPLIFVKEKNNSYKKAEMVIDDGYPFFVTDSGAYNPRGYYLPGKVNR